MELRLRAEYVPSGWEPAHGLSRIPGQVSVRLRDAEGGWTEVLSLPAASVPGPQPDAEDEVIVDALQQFFVGLQELTDRTDALLGLADNSR